MMDSKQIGGLELRYTRVAAIVLDADAGVTIGSAERELLSVAAVTGITTSVEFNGKVLRVNPQDFGTVIQTSKAE